MTAGRPTEYREEMLEKIQDYINGCKDTLINGQKHVNIPTIEGVSLYLGINKDTLYQWCKIHKEFSDLIDDMRSEQAVRLLNNGLAGTYSPVIAKVLLTKHGYREGQDITTNDKDLPQPIANVQRNISDDKSQI